ncbi:radical SAM protein [Nitrosomonas ureae]|uniref:Wyosine [tRNA(Phe)-imidazoG37] synthetase, radical SAM superfamily n=1 Tax=Nitrosomonas ureae TaxID=44577 RepID=A0A286AC14_9PROT|nr:radical SAM protein [Nitrosomonas ureae]SOD19436.1 Wyosine [tRNA(Phe)-imidazoG37] synthetase, radical SAM superfamily [Nitrosomonas ureae]
MQPKPNLLNTINHSRDSAGLTYVYPVISRRAGGVSIGINLNPNNACNWRCVYCQVPELKRGSAPRIDLSRLESELQSFLRDLIHGDFMHKQVPPEARKIHDIALSGNGEPTSAKEFDQVIELIGRVKKDFALPEDLKIVLITNGSLIYRPTVQAGLKQMAELNGEVWFKFDRALATARQYINNTSISLRKINDHLRITTSLCPTWLQTCVFQINAMPPAEEEIVAYLNFLQQLINNKIPLKGVLLYGIARPSLQPEAVQLSTVDESWLSAYAKRIEALGIAVKINP